MESERGVHGPRNRYPGVRTETTPSLPIGEGKPLRGFVPLKRSNRRLSNRAERLRRVLIERRGINPRDPQRLGVLPDGRLALLACCGKEYVFALEGRAGDTFDYAPGERSLRIVNPPAPLSGDEAKRLLESLLAGSSWVRTVEDIRRQELEARRRVAEFDQDIQMASTRTKHS